MPKPSGIPGREIISEEGERAEERLPGLTSSSQVVPKKSRRRFSASEKTRLLKAAAAAVASGQQGALEALLRREGIYSSHLAAWRQQVAARGASGLEAQKPGRKPKLDETGRQLLAVTKENAKLKRKLLVAHAVIELQKKAHEVLGIALPEFDDESL